MVPLTFGVSVQFCSEAEWTNGDVGGDSKHEVFLGWFDWLLGLFADHIDHLRLEARWADKQRQTQGVWQCTWGHPIKPTHSIPCMRQAKTDENPVTETLSRPHSNCTDKAL